MKGRPPESPVRWREDVGWEFRCEDCAARHVACFWPLTDEYWDKARGMKRCRSCFRALDARRARQRYLASTTVRERKLEAERRYRQKHRDAQRIVEKLRWEAVKADPEKHAHVRELARVRRQNYVERRRAA